MESCQLTNDSDRLMQIEAVRTQAMNNHNRHEAHEALRAALLCKRRPYRGSFHTPPPPRSAPHDGEGTAEGHRQGIVLSVERNPVSCNAAVNLWIRNSHDSIVQSAPEQVRPVYGEQAVVSRSPESQDLEVLKTLTRVCPRLEESQAPGSSM